MGSFGASGYPQTYYEDINLTEKQKLSKDYLEGNANHWIANLIRDKKHIKTLRDYYSGIRDAKDFEYLTDNFGIGSPSTLKFTNLIKPRIDSLVAQIEEDSHDYAVSCTDTKTIDTIQETRKRKKIESVLQSLEKFGASIKQSIQSGGRPATYSEVRAGIKSIESKLDSNFLSDFEIAAHKVLTYFDKSNRLDIKRKLATLALDLLITGECYWRVSLNRLGSDPIFEVIKPENFFHNKSTNSPYLDSTDAVVRREFMSHKEVAMKYGKYMTADQLKTLFGQRFLSTYGRAMGSGIDLDVYYSDDDPVLGQKHYSFAHTIEVMHVEWLATNEVEAEEEDQLSAAESNINKPIKKLRRIDRYECTRIGGTEFVNCGKSSNIIRSADNPNYCTFSYGGIVYNDRGGKPYSVVGSMKDLQDIYDLTIFFRDNLVANSGVQGDRINVAGIPKVLGNDFMERLFRFIALKKNGLELIDPTEQGAQLFNHYGSFDNTVNGNSLIAIDSLLRSIESQADVLAGTNPHMLGDIRERDAVKNVEVGIKRSLMINQSLFELFRANHLNIMSSLLQNAQKSYISGKKISYIAGAESYVFDILPETFCHTDYAINISYTSKDAQKLAEIKQLAKDLIIAQAIDPDVIAKTVMSDSVTEISKLITENWNKRKEETNQLTNTLSQLEQVNKQLKELQMELNNAKQQLEASKASDTQIKQQETAAKIQNNNEDLAIKREKLNIDRDYNDKQIELKKEIVQLEREQLYLDTGSSREVKNL